MGLSEGVERKTKNFVQIADTIIEIIINESYLLGNNYKPFNTSREPGGAKPIRLSCRKAPPCFDARALPFQTGETVQSKFLMRKRSCLFMRKDEVLISRSNFDNCWFWSASRDYLTDSIPFLGDCGWPLLALWGKLSVSGSGILLHGSLLRVQDRYILLLGASGAGKTTLSKLAVNEGAVCLTDENPFLRVKNRTPYVYGTPWFSDPEFFGIDKQASSSISGPLEAVFVIYHAPSNRIRKLTKKEAGFAVLKHTRTFNWLPSTIPGAISLLDTVVANVPIYSLGFLPNRSAVDFLARESR